MTGVELRQDDGTEAASWDSAVQTEASFRFAKYAALIVAFGALGFIFTDQLHSDDPMDLGGAKAGETWRCESGAPMFDRPNRWIGGRLRDWTPIEPSEMVVVLELRESRWARVRRSDGAEGWVMQSAGRWRRVAGDE